MKILVVGSGGREHAIAWKVAQAKDVDKVFVAPGNAGTAIEAGLENVAIGVNQIEDLVDFAKKNKVHLTIIGPEDPLVNGIIDAFNQAGLRCFGPTKGAAQLEGSKVFCKDFLARHHIHTAEYGVFTAPAGAEECIRKMGFPVVIKADGLAAGKGVIIAHSEAEAMETVTGMLSGRSFGEAGKRVIIEKCLQGEEASYIVMVDGKNILPLATSQDHKARDNGDEGPNTGGMGAYSPAPVITPELSVRVMNEVIIPTVKGMALEGNPYTGFLYAGLMIAPDGTPMVLEYNCRFGDPETQPILLRLKSNFVTMCDAALDEKLDRIAVTWDQRAALGVVMAAGGYPLQYEKGEIISGLPDGETPEVKVFHAGTAMREGHVVTNGGRVLCVTALGETVREAQSRAYGMVEKIHWNNACYRTDIGYRAIARELEQK